MVHNRTEYDCTTQNRRVGLSMHRDIDGTRRHCTLFSLDKINDVRLALPEAHVTHPTGSLPLNPSSLCHSFPHPIILPSVPNPHALSHLLLPPAEPHHPLPRGGEDPRGVDWGGGGGGGGYLRYEMVPDYRIDRNYRKQKAIS